MAELTKKVYYHEGPDGKMHPDLVEPSTANGEQRV